MSMPPPYTPAAEQEHQQLPVAPQPALAYGAASGPRAGFWQRFAAAFLDGVVLVVANLILVRVFGGAAIALELLVGGAYFTYFVGATRGQTPGEMALGLRVISFDDGSNIGHGRAFIRWIGSYISALCLLLGYFWMLWDKEKQCWHDKLAGCVVVPVSAYPPPR